MPTKKQNPLNITIASIGGRGAHILSRLESLEKENGVKRISIGTKKALRYSTDIEQEIELPENALLEQTQHDDFAGVDALCGKSKDIEKMFSSADILFVIGNISNPINVQQAVDIIRIAKQTATLVFYVSATPFAFEGTKKQKLTEKGKALLETVADGFLCIESNKVLEKGGSAKRAFTQVDVVIADMIQMITDIVTQFGIINVDFADLKTTVQHTGKLYFNHVEGSKNEINALTKKMFEDSILDTTTIKMKQALYIIHAGKQVFFEEIQAIGEKIQSHLDEHARVIFGIVEDNTLKNDIRIVFIGG